MKKELRHVGLDVHSQSVSVAVCDEHLVEFVGKCLNTADSVVKQLRKLGEPCDLVVVYEAGPTGYSLCRSLLSRGCNCSVIVPTLIPKMPGDSVRRGAITKAGNTHLRRVMEESGWAYRFAPRLGYDLKRRQRGVDSKITDLSWRAQKRLHKCYRYLLATGKHHNKVIGAMARELLGFVWAVGIEAELQFKRKEKVA